MLAVGSGLLTAILVNSAADELATPSPGPTAAATPSPSRGPAENRTSRARTYLVVHVVDGDTLDLANGARVRLVGIDTPEHGQCGFDRASTALSRLVLDRRVRLTVAGEARDRYGRLLRYVDVPVTDRAGRKTGEIDAGLRLVRDGLAVARYDSRDGYGHHPRQERYVAADRASASPCARPASRAP